MCLSIYLSIYLFVCLFIYLFIYRSIHPSIHPSIHLYSEHHLVKCFIQIFTFIILIAIYAYKSNLFLSPLSAMVPLQPHWGCRSCLCGRTAGAQSVVGRWRGHRFGSNRTSPIDGEFHVYIIYKSSRSGIITRYQIVFARKFLFFSGGTLSSLNIYIYNPWDCGCIFTTKQLPSGELTFCHEKSPCLMGKSTISMAIFNSYLYVHQRVISKS